MSESAGRVKAWMYIYVDDEGSEEFEFSTGRGCSGYANEFGATETALVPEQLLVEVESERDGLIDLCNERGEALGDAIEREQAALDSLDALRSAVRALADEWRTEVGDCDPRPLSVAAVHECADELIRALTQTPTEAVKK